MSFWAQTEMWYARRDVPAILFACQKSPKTVFWQKLTKNNEKMPFWAQTEMWYARRDVPAILFAWQKSPKIVFNKNWLKITKDAILSSDRNVICPKGRSRHTFCLSKYQKPVFFQPGFWKSPDFDQNRIWKKNAFQKKSENYENKWDQHEISRGIHFWPPQGSEIGQIQIF